MGGGRCRRPRNSRRPELEIRAALPFLGLPRPLMGRCVAHLMNHRMWVLGRRMVGHEAHAGSPKSGPPLQVWAHDSSAREGHPLPSAPTTGHGECFCGTPMVPSSSKHGGGHRSRVAGATGACCMGVARALVCPVHTNAMVHSMGHTQALDSPRRCPSPRERQLLAQLLIQLTECWGCASAVHNRLAGCNKRQRRRIMSTGTELRLSGALLSLTVR